MLLVIMGITSTCLARGKLPLMLGTIGRSEAQIASGIERLMLGFIIPLFRKKEVEVYMFGKR